MSALIKYTIPVILLLGIFSCQDREILEKSLEKEGVDYGLPPQGNSLFWEYHNNNGNEINVIVESTDVYRKLYPGTSLDFFHYQNKIRNLTISRNIRFKELHKDPPMPNSWIVLYYDNWLVKHEPFDTSDRLKTFRNIDFFSTTGGANFLLYLPLEMPQKFTHKTQAYWQHVASKIEDVESIEVEGKDITVLKIQTFSNKEPYSTE